MSSVDPAIADQAVNVVPPREAAPVRSLIHRINAFIRRHTSRFLNVWSALTLILVAGIFVLCALLWEFESLRPILATVGAGLAAFLGRSLGSFRLKLAASGSSPSSSAQ